MVVEVIYHPYFLEWFEELVDVNIEVAGEIQALIDALAAHGRDLGDPESHPVVTSRLGLRALRRTPPTSVTPYAEEPPVMRVLSTGSWLRPKRGCERCCSSEGTRRISATAGTRPTSPKPSGDSRSLLPDRAGGS